MHIKAFSSNIFFYYIDTSVLLENKPLVKLIKTRSETEWFVFHNLTSKFIDDVTSVITYNFSNFTHTFFKALLIFYHCRVLFSSLLFLKILVNNVLYCCTVTLSHHNYFLANKILLFYRCLFVYIIKRTLHGRFYYEFHFLVAKTIFYSLAALVHKIWFCHSKIKFISLRHVVISSI